MVAKRLARVDVREVQFDDDPGICPKGVGDRLLSARAGLQIARRVPGARLVSFDGSGHCPHEEEPERFNAVLRDFLDGDG